MRHSSRATWTNLWAASLGNLFEHYDKALYGFLVPFIADQFFGEGSGVTGLILAYAVLPLGLISRPLGAWYFGRLGDRLGRKPVLVCSLVGMSVVTLLMGCLPTFTQVAWWAPALLALCRLAQGIFAAAESTGGTLLVLENAPEEKRGILSGLYDCSTILGILAASLGVTLLAQWGNVEESWRWLYWAGGVTGLTGLVVRYYSVEAPRQPPPEDSPRLIQLLFDYRWLFVTIIVTKGFSYANYYMVTTMLAGYVPLVTALGKAKVMQGNTLLLLADLMLLPIGGWLAGRFPRRPLLMIYSLIIAVAAIPVYYQLAGGSFVSLMWARLFFVAVGVGFSAALRVYLQDITPDYCRFTLISLGTAIGSQLIGTSSCGLGLWLYESTGWVAAPALYLSTGALLSLALLARRPTKTPQLSAAPA